jgi:hypothetical protein
MEIGVNSFILNPSSSSISVKYIVEQQKENYA